jgi:gamma-glutamylcysteine synthetase
MLEHTYELDAELERVATVALKAQLHVRNNQPDESARAIERARSLFAAIDRDAVSKQGLEQRYREVGELIGGNPAGRP